nr:Putative histidine kinase [Methylocystis sp. SC2]
MLLAGAIFTRLDEDAYQTGGHRPPTSASASSPIIATSSASAQAFDGEFVEGVRRLAEHSRLADLLALTRLSASWRRARNKPNLEASPRPSAKLERIP